MDQSEFVVFIKEETRDGLQRLQAAVGDPAYLVVGCVDGLTEKGTLNIPGGGLMIWKEGFLDDFLQTRSGSDGIFHVHWYCGYLFVMQGLTTLEEHQDAIKDFILDVNRLNAEYGTNFKVHVETNGSAQPYMDALLV